jgi:hypothetical protein
MRQAETFSYLFFYGSSALSLALFATASFDDK